MEQGRTKNYIFNVGSGFLNALIKAILTFATRTIFIKVLGETYLGVNGLLTNILSMLSIAELGIGTAISFSLYKPIANKEDLKISILMSFYKKAYRIIGIIILALGFGLIPFLDFILEKNANIDAIYIIYILYLLNTVSTYFISYKELLIVADQKSYKLTKINFVFDVLLNVIQISLLLLFKNFIIYLIVQILVGYVKRIIINNFISKQYQNINFSLNEKLDKNDKAVLSKNIKAMFLHKIGDYCINGTDSIIITRFVGLATVGIYSNYLEIINIINSFILIIYNAVIASLGNLIVLENKDKRLEVFKIMNFVGFLIFSFCGICLFNLFNPFIRLWVGEQYVFPIQIVAIIVLNFYITGMRVPLGTIKSAAGIYSQDKYIPLIQAGINIGASIILVKYVGVIGILIGTLISSILPAINRPVIVYKYVFEIKSYQYFIKYLKYGLTFLLGVILTKLIIYFIHIENEFLYLIVLGIISVTIYVLLIFIIYRNTYEYQYIYDNVKKLLKKLFKK